MNINDIVIRFADDRESLSDEELAALVEAAARDADLARRLKEEMMFDELLSHRLGTDRADFSAQVRQRIRDLGRPLRAPGRPVRRNGRSVHARRRPAGPAWGRWIAVAACLAIVVGTVVYNYRKAGRFDEAVIAYVKTTATGVEIVRSGGAIAVVLDMPVRIGDRIRTDRAERLTLRYRDEETEIDVEESTLLDMGDVTGGKKLHLEAGTINARVAPQPAGAPMVVSTPQAIAEVKGTVFSLVASARDKSTRLEVFEGLVSLTRLSDKASVDVPAGQYAVAAEGVELAVAALPADRIRESSSAVPVGTGPVASGELNKETGPRLHLYGKTLFEDEFDGSLDNWDTVVGTVDGGFETVAESPERYVELMRDHSHQPTYAKKVMDEVETCAWIWANRAGDRFVGVRSRKPVASDRFAVILRSGVVFIPGEKRREAYCLGVEIRSGDVLGTVFNRYPKGGGATWHQAMEWHVWEFTREPGPEPVYVCREFVNDMRRGKAYEWARIMMAYRVRPVSRRLLVAAGGVNMVVDKVIVKEILEENEVNE